MGVAASSTTNPLLLTGLALALVTVVMARGSSGGWARSIRAYLWLSLFVIGMRLFFQMLLGGARGTTVLFTLPRIPLPQWAVGIQLGGPVTAEALASACYDALRLAVMLLCVGAANALANPRTALRSVPAALYEASVAVVIALSVAPQLIESAQRVHRARRLRGDSSRSLRALATVALPVVADAIDRSMALAAAMESRGFARTRGRPRPGALAAMLVSAATATFGVFLLLSTNLWVASIGLLIGGCLGTALGLRAAGRRLRITRYRPLPWRWRETLVAGSGLLAAAGVLGVGWTTATELSGFLEPAALMPSTYPLVWPQLTWPMLVVVLLSLAPLPLTAQPTPRPPDTTRVDHPLRELRPRPVLAEAARR